MGCVYLVYEELRKQARKEEGTRKYSSSNQACPKPEYQGVVGRLGRHSQERHLLSGFPPGVIHPAPINQLHRKLMNELKREPAQ